MEGPQPATKFAAAFVAGSLLFTSGATAAVRAGDFVASPVLTTASVQAAACAAGAASTAAAGAASVTQAVQSQPGCVLPVTDAPSPAPVAEASPPAYVPAAATTGGGIGVLPLLLGLAAIAGGIALLLGDGDDDQIELPTSRG